MRGTLSVPLLMSVSERFSVPFLTLVKPCYAKALEWSSLVPGPKAKSSSEITNPTLFAVSYHYLPTLLLCAGPGCVLFPIPAYIPTITSSLLFTSSNSCFLWLAELWGDRSLIYMQSTSWETLGWMKHKLESRLQGEISIASDMQMTPP